MGNFTVEQPPLPTYELHKEADLFSFISDKNLGLILPVLVYSILTLFWIWIDSLNIWEQYRLHPTEEILKRNQISKLECLKGVALYHITAFAATVGLTWSDSMETFSGDEEYSIALWASKIRTVQGVIPIILSVVGIDAVSLANSLSGSFSGVAGALRGGIYPDVKQVIDLVTGEKTQVPAFSSWEILTATMLYYVAVPFVQFMACFFIADTWSVSKDGRPHLFPVDCI